MALHNLHTQCGGIINKTVPHYIATEIDWPPVKASYQSKNYLLLPLVLISLLLENGVLYT